MEAHNMILLRILVTHYPIKL